MDVLVPTKLLLDVGLYDAVLSVVVREGGRRSGCGVKSGIVRWSERCIPGAKPTASLRTALSSAHARHLRCHVLRVAV